MRASWTAFIAATAGLICSGIATAQSDVPQRADERAARRAPPADRVEPPPRPEPNLGTGAPVDAALETQVVLGDLEEGIAMRWKNDVLVTFPSSHQAAPAITTTPYGTLYIAVEDHGPEYDGWVRLYRSTNDGASWQYLARFISGSASRHPSLAYAEGMGERWLYMAYEMTGSSDKYVYVLRVNPDNLLDSHVAVVQGPIAATPEVYPRLCTDNNLWNNYYVYVTYTVNAVDYYAVMFARSTDRGLTFETPKNITGGSENSSDLTRPDIACGTAGLFVAFEKPGWTGSEWKTQVWVTRSANYGGAWTTPEQLTTAAYGAWHPSVAAAVGQPTVMVAYTRGYSDDTDIHSAWSTDGGSTYTKNQSLPWSYSREKTVDLAVSDNDGRFHAAFWRDYEIHYTWTDATAPHPWVTATVVNEAKWASGVWTLPAICVNPSKPLGSEACVSWTDYRGMFYDVYFDANLVPPCANDPSGFDCDTDANGDCVINNNDLGILLASYLAESGDANFNSAVDFNNDGRITNADLGELLADYLRNCN